MNIALQQLIRKYEYHGKPQDLVLREVLQHLALLGLWRSKFYEKAAFYGGTALRVLYQLDRFSEDLDFSLLEADPSFDWEPHLKSIEREIQSMGLDVVVSKKEKTHISSISSAFIKGGTLTNLIQIEVDPTILAQTHSKQVMKIKIELDTVPPAVGVTKMHTLLVPVPFQVRAFEPSVLFAGKIAALLLRRWKNRVKGRDVYDFVWYLSQGIPCQLSYLQAYMEQTGHWDSRTSLDSNALKELLTTYFSEVDLFLAKQDVFPFIADSAALELWSKEFFLEQLSNLNCTV